MGDEQKEREPDDEEKRCEMLAFGHGIAIALRNSQQLWLLQASALQHPSMGVGDHIHLWF